MTQKTDTPAPTQIPPCSPAAYVDARGATPSPKPPAASSIDLFHAYGAQQHAGHRSPATAGSADRYYGRPCKPNFAYQNHTYSAADMTDEQIRLYEEAWDRETDRKQW